MVPAARAEAREGSSDPLESAMTARKPEGEQAPADFVRRNNTEEQGRRRRRSRGGELGRECPGSAMAEARGDQDGMGGEGGGDLGERRRRRAERDTSPTEMSPV